MTHPRKTAPTSKEIAGHWIGRPPPGTASGLPICDVGEPLPEGRLAEILSVAMTRVGTETHAGCFSPGTIARILSEAVVIGAKEDPCSTPSPS